MSDLGKFTGTRGWFELPLPIIATPAKFTMWRPRPQRCPKRVVRLLSLPRQLIVYSQPRGSLRPFANALNNNYKATCTLKVARQQLHSQLTHLFKCWLMSRWDDWTFNTLGVSRPLWSVGQQCRCCCRTPACWRYSTILLTYNTYIL